MADLGHAGPRPGRTGKATRPGRRKTLTAAGIESLRRILTSYRHLDDELGPFRLRQGVASHLQMVQSLYGTGCSASVETALGSVEAEFAQLVGWLAFDARDCWSAEHYFLKTLEAADTVGDHAVAAYAMKWLSLLAIDQGDGPEAVQRAQAALRRVRKSGTASGALGAAVLSAKARAHAKAGEPDACRAALDQAEDQWSGADPASVPPFLYYFDHAAMAGHRGIALALLGDSGPAQTALREAVAAMPDNFVRDKAFFTAHLAAVLAHSGEIPEACTVATDAADLLDRSSSGRTTQLLREIDLQVATGHRSRALPEVHALHMRLALL